MLVVERLDAGGGEVLRVDELVAVAAVADDPDFFVVVDELEEDGEEAEAAAVDDGGAADGDDVEIVGRIRRGSFLRRVWSGRRARWDWVARLR